jgi:hypothetical protein
MNLDPRKHAIDEHKRWIGYLQPEGVVVAPVALVDFGAQLDASQFNPVQERFTESIARDNDGAPVIPSFAQFARAFLGWKDSLLDIFAVDDEVPDALRIATGDYGELLRPDAAYRHLTPPDPARPWMLLIRQLAPGTKFDAIPDEDRAHGWVASPVQKFERLLRATDIAIGILCNGTDIRLLYAPRGENAGSLTFPVRFLTELPGRAATTALEMLLSHRRLIGVNEAQRLPALLKKSREYQGAVSTQLAEQVLEALYDLVRGFQAADVKARGTLLRDVLARDPDEIYHGLLTLLLRLVFLLFAEDRGLMPGGSLYNRNYSIHGLFEKLRAAHERYPDTMDGRLGAYAQLLTVSRLVFEGCRHGELKMPARLGHLFDPHRFPFLEGRIERKEDVRAEGHQLPLVSDGTLFRVLEKLLLLDGERLSYRALDVEQIGSVYQTMIGFTLEIARGTSIALKPAKSKGAPAFLDLDALLAIEPGKRAEHLQKLTDHKLTGNPAAALKTAQTHDDLLAALERKIARAASPDKVAPGSLILQPTDERRRSGSHYTPRVLTAPIVRKTLDPILARLGKNPTPQQILELKICDKAVGSGAFLVEGCRQLGDALVAAWQHHGGKPVIPPDEDELLHARRLVAQRCLYGVDRNPMAVDLAKLSLWLATLAKDHPFTFLDHSLRAGDALVGLSKKQIVAFHWDLTAPEAKQRQFGQQRVENAIELATSFRREILEGGDFLMPDVKAERLKRADSALDEARRAGDLCIAAFFGGDKPKARAALRERYLDTLIEIISASPLPFDKIKEVEAIIAQLRKGAPHPVTPFHWEIEFPEVFARENGGFDAFVGNPPYMGGTRISESGGMAYFQWLVTRFPPCEHHCDLVAYFFRQAFNLLRDKGSFGLIATNSISQGDTREGGLRVLLRDNGQIFDATPRYKWPGLAAVIVSVVHVAKGFPPLTAKLNGKTVSRISAYLLAGEMDESPQRLVGNPYFSIGSKIYGQGFLFANDEPGCTPIEERSKLLKTHPEWESRIPPYIGGEEINTDPAQHYHRFAIYLSDAETEAELDEWPELRDIVATKVKPEREKLGNNPNNVPLKKKWWAYQAHRPELYQRIAKMDRVLVSSQVSAQFGFALLPTTWMFAQTANLFCIGNFAGFAVIQSRLHELWARFLASSMKDDMRYTASDCFETFPFPAGWETDAALEAAGREYYEARAALMVSHHEGLTKTYNRFHDPAEDAPGIHRLRRLHAALDHAVLAAYGWSDLVAPGPGGAAPRTACEFLPDYYDEPEQEGGAPLPKSIRHRWPDATRDEVLARLLKLNAERAAEEAAEKKREDAKEPRKKSAAKKPAQKKTGGAAPAQGELVPPPQTDMFAT